MKYFYLLILVFLIDASASCPVDCTQVQCVQGFNPLECPDGTVYINKAAMCGCCPGCVRFRGINEQCSGDTTLTFDITNYYTSRTYLSTGLPPVVESQDCPPGVQCVSGKCEDKYTCLEYQVTGAWKPACDFDGSFKAVQCKENGAFPRCFCYNKAGTRIFGFDWLEKRDKMHCLCSRLVDDLKKSSNGANIDITFHCSSNGNFEPLQCNRGMCYCADEYTGQPISDIVPEAVWTMLPCYNKTNMGSIYLRNCDSQRNALALIMKETALHGSTPQISAPPCDPDGSYSPKQCTSAECFCRTRANANIGAYFTTKGTDLESQQLCYCARDQVILEAEGMHLEYDCQANGNYKTFQVIGDQALCIDGDGFILEYTQVDQLCISPLLTCLPPNTCPTP